MPQEVDYKVQFSTEDEPLGPEGVSKIASWSWGDGKCPWKAEAGGYSFQFKAAT